MQLLDSPGLLWPKFEDQEAAKRLVLVASIRDEVVDPVEIVWWFLEYLQAEYPQALEERYGSFDQGAALWKKSAAGGLPA